MKLLKWLLYFICLLAPFAMLYPVNFNYNFILIIAAFLISLLTILVVNKKKDDTNLVIMPASMVMKRGLIHPEISLLCASSLFSAVAILHGHLEADYNVFSGTYFTEAWSAITSGTNTLVGILMLLPVLSLVLFLFKFVLSAHTKSLASRTVWYIILYVLALLPLVLTFGFTKVNPSNYFKAFEVANNKLLVIIIVAVCLAWDIFWTFALWIRSHKLRKLAMHRQERLHDIDDIDEYTHKQLMEQQAYEKHQKRVDKKQRKLNKKLRKQNKKLHKRAVKFEKYLAKHPELQEKEKEEVLEAEAEKPQEEVIEEAKENLEQVPEEEVQVVEVEQEAKEELPQEEPQKELSKKEKKQLEKEQKKQRKEDIKKAKRQAKLDKKAAKKQAKLDKKQAKLDAKNAKKQAKLDKKNKK